MHLLVVQKTRMSYVDLLSREGCEKLAFIGGINHIKKVPSTSADVYSMISVQ